MLMLMLMFMVAWYMVERYLVFEVFEWFEKIEKEETEQTECAWQGTKYFQWKGKCVFKLQNIFKVKKNSI